MPAPASIGVLGPLEVQIGGVPLILAGERSRRILGALVDAGANGASIDRLAWVIWDDHDRPDEPTAHVRTAISRLRRAFNDADSDGSALIESRPGGYRLAASVDVDAWSFEEELADRSRNGQSKGQRLLDLETTLERWRGDPYADLADVMAFTPSITRLNDLRLAAEEERLGLLLQDGGNQQVVSRASVLAEANPWREELHRLHALALYRNGRQADALAALRNHARAARDDLGLDPGPALVALENEILNHDPKLTHKHVATEALRGYQVHETLRRSDSPLSVVRRRATQKAIGTSVIIETIDLASLPESVTAGDVMGWVRQRSALQHPSIEPVLDYWRDPASMHLVLPLPVRSLDDELAIGTLDMTDAATLAAQVARAVDVAHQAGLVHGSLDASSITRAADRTFVLGCFPPFASQQDPSADIAGLARVVAAVVTGAPTANLDSLERMLRGAAHPTTAAQLIVESQRGNGAVSGEEFARRFIEATGVEVEVDGVDADRENPYPGLMSFDESNAADFHGREAIVEELCDRWRNPTERLLVVAGASGSGKSSVLRAGLVPALRAGAVDGSDKWALTVMRPGTDPMQSLAEAISGVATGVGANPAELLNHKAATGDNDPLGATIAQVLDEDTELVLVIDQFEELFQRAKPHEQDTADEFLDLLAIALQTPESRVRIAVALRADWLDRPLQRQPFAALFRQAIVPLARMNAHELERLIAVPASQRGVEITPSLRSTLVDDVLAESSALPLLAVALRELWSSRSRTLVIDVDDYEQLGGLAGALVGSAETLVESLGKHGAEELRRLFGRTVAIEPTGNAVRRTAPLADVLAAGVSEMTVNAAIRARLVTADHDPMTREPTVTPAHDALLKSWPRLAEWLHEDRARLHEHQRLASAARSWNEDRQDKAMLLRGSRLDLALDLARADVALTPIEAALVDASDTERKRQLQQERAQTRRQRNLTVVACLVAIIALIAGLLAVTQGRRAEQAATTAEIRLMTQSALAQFNQRPALGLHLALGAHEHGGGPDAEAVLIDLLGREPFDRQIGTAVDSICIAASTAPRPAVLAFAARGADGRSEITSWDVATGGREPAGSVEIPQAPCPHVSPDGERLAMLDGESLHVVAVATGQIIASAEIGRTRDIEWTITGSRLIALFDEDGGRIDVLDPATLRVDQSIELDTDFASALAVGADAALAIVTSDAKQPLVVDLDRGSIRELDDSGQLVVTAAVDRAGSMVLGRSDTSVMAWDVETGQVLWTRPHGRERSMGPVAVNASGSHAATTGTEGVLLLDTRTGEATAQPLPIATEQPGLWFFDDDELIVTGAGDRINVLSVAPKVDVVHDNIPVGAVSPDGTVLIPDGTDEAFEAILVSPTGERTLLSTTPINGVPTSANSVVGYEYVDRHFVMWLDGERSVDVDLSDRFSEDSRHGRTVRIGEGLIVLQVMDPFLDTSTFTTLIFQEKTGTLIAELKTPDENLAMPIAPDRIAMASVDFAVRIMDLAGNTTQDVGRFGHPVSAIALASDGDLLIGLGDGTVHRRDPSSEEISQPLVGPPSSVLQILNFEGGFLTSHLNGAVLKWYDDVERPAGTIHQAVGFGGLGALNVEQDAVLYPEPGRVVRIPIGLDAFIEEACRRAGLEIDRDAWAAFTTTDPEAVEDLCRDALAD